MNITITSSWSIPYVVPQSVVRCMLKQGKVLNFVHYKIIANVHNRTDVINKLNITSKNYNKAFELLFVHRRTVAVTEETN